MQQHVNIPDTPRQIEAQLDQDRDDLSKAFAALCDRFSVGNIWSEGASLLKSNAGPYTQALDAAVRANPVALAVSAVGLAWLILGRRNADQATPSPLAGTRFEAEARWEDEGGPVVDLPDTDAGWMAEADTLRLRASALIEQINRALHDKLAPAATLAKSRADVLQSLTQDVRRVMQRGLEGVSGPALEAALVTRERAYAARLSVAKASVNAVQDHPITVGLACAAAGAALAALLPQSTLENRLLGAPRDRILQDAAHVLHDERRRFAQSVNRVANAMISDVAP